ncbi:MAG: DUF2161 family putative PD-(D/E)XK-type phosphodiesterase, partial [Spirochaetaceae bacterium]|nr:DUF2161 family putative PD-(D/E)XK-type phosphodiesterase [Spirochaetaceae bacterium]
MVETDLYPPLKAWLETQGYLVRGEVGRCDIAAEKDGELIVVELKLKPSLVLLSQAVERQEYADGVYIALPTTPERPNPPAARGLRRLLRRLGIGLVLVRFLKTRIRVEVAMHPGAGIPRRRPGRKAALIREIAGRDLDLTPGGGAGGAQKVTAYRHRCVRLAAWLSELGEASPARLRQLGAPEDSVRCSRKTCTAGLNGSGAAPIDSIRRAGTHWISFRNWPPSITENSKIACDKGLYEQKISLPPVPETGIQGSCIGDEGMIRRHGFRALGHIFQGNALESKPIVRGHLAEISAVNHLGRVGTEFRRHHPIPRRGTTAPLNIAEDGLPGFKASDFLYLMGNKPSCGHGSRFSRRLGRQCDAFGDNDDGIRLSQRRAAVEIFGDDVQIVGYLGNQNHISACGHPGIQGEPSGAVAHHLHHHDPVDGRGGENNDRP